MLVRKTVFSILAIIGIGIFGSDLQGQVIKYRDGEGNQVFTNVPPVNPTPGMEIIGSAATETVSVPKSRTVSYDAIIEKYAFDYSLDPSLIRSIIATESGFNPRAVSPKGARGLMQLMPATAERLGVKNSFDPEQNIHGGVKHFRTLMDNFNNDLTLSLAAYNAGENLVQRLGRVPEIKETREYVQSVTKRFNATKELSIQPNQEEDKPAQIFRSVDESGVLYLSNIPPTR